MRLTLYFTLFISFISSALFSQVNSYLQDGMVWKMSSGCAAPYPCIINETYNYTINGDSIINSQVYKKIYRKGTGYRTYMGGGPNNCSGTFSYIDPIPVFLLRSSGKKIFIHNSLAAGTEDLLYDFDLNINDTLPVTYNNDQSNVTVISVDSILTPNGYRKQFGLSGPSLWSYILIEGIGHEKGLVEPLNVALECGWQLLCFGANDSAYYPNSGPTCEIPVGMIESKQDAFSFYPNPATDYLTINCNSDQSKMTLIRLFDALGREVLYNESRETSSTIDLSNLSPGMYSLSIEREKPTYHKLIINKN